MARRPLRWTEHAVLQLAAITEYISLDSPVYAEQVLDRLVSRLEQARTFPQSGRVVPEVARDDVREFIEPPYRLIYRVGAELVEVLSVLHSRREAVHLPEEA